MRPVFRLDAVVTPDPAVEAWLAARPGVLGALAEHAFELLRASGYDVREVLHDDQPTACVKGGAFAYVGAYKNHVSVGFFHGAELPDPAGLLEGTGRFMRHVKLRPEVDFDLTAVKALIDAAHADIVERLAAERG